MWAGTTLDRPVIKVGVRYFPEVLALFPVGEAIVRSLDNELLSAGSPSRPNLLALKRLAHPRLRGCIELAPVPVGE